MSATRLLALCLVICTTAACKGDDPAKKANSNANNTTPNAVDGNNAPVARDDSASTPENTAVTIDVLGNDSDPDGDMLSVVETTAPTNGTAVPTGGRVSYTPGANFAGQDSFTYTVSDGRGGTASASVSVSVVGEPNDPPVAMDDRIDALAGVSVSIDVLANDSDPNGDPLTVIADTPAQFGTFERNGGTFTYTPPADMGGTDFFTYTIDDAHQGTAIGRVFVTIDGPPQATDDAVDMLVDTTIQIDVLANDIEPEGQTLTVDSITPTASGTATIVGDLVQYVPNAGFEGFDSFDYVTSDPNGLTATGSVTIEVVAPFKGYKLSAGDSHVCQVRTNGTLVCWGNGSSGRLGNGSSLDEPSPNVVGAATDWLSVAAGQYHSCGIRANGTLWCWGGNSDDQLGIPGQSSTNAPLQVGTEMDWGIVTAGDGHTCATKTDGRLFCVGNNRDGQTGTDGSSSITSMTQVGAEFGWVRVDAGYNHTCGIRGAGSLWCWGEGRSGQLGQMTTGGSDVPVRVGTNADWDRISTGYEFTCGIRAGALYCWGSGRSGQLGTGGTSDVVSPSQIGSQSDWDHVSAGREHTCAVRSGQLFCWGDNQYGQLGNGTLDMSLNPVRVGTASDWDEVFAGWQFTCASKTNGSVQCWGVHRDGQLGIGATVSALTPQRVGNATNWDYVETSAVATCGVDNTGEMQCWGSNQDGQLANNSNADAQYPTPALGGGDWAQLGHGPETLCGIKSNGALYCWGSNWLGMLGDGTQTDKLIPTRITSQLYQSADGGRQHSCAVRTDGSMWCWGRNTHDQLGLDPSIIESLSPVQIGVDLNWQMVDVGEWLSCGLKAGSVFCWGDFIGGVPVQQGTEIDYTSISMGGVRVCALKANGTLWCWTAGQPPAQVGSDSDWQFVAGDAEDHICGIRTDNTLWCWGENRAGQLGDGTLTNRGAPGQVGFSSDWTSVTTGGSFFGGHTCGTRANGQLFCWGANDSAQLGLGGLWYPSPQPVVP